MIDLRRPTVVMNQIQLQHFEDNFFHYYTSLLIMREVDISMNAFAENHKRILMLGGEGMRYQCDIVLSLNRTKP